jgi:hypothetical protein
MPRLSKEGEMSLSPRGQGKASSFRTSRGYHAGGFAVCLETISGRVDVTLLSGIITISGKPNAYVPR